VLSKLLTCGRGRDGLSLIVAVRLLADGLPVGRAACIAPRQARRGAVSAIVGGIAGGIAGVGGNVGGRGFREAGEAPFRFLIFGGVHGVEAEG